MRIPKTVTTAMGALALSVAGATASTVKIEDGDSFAIGPGEDFGGIFDVESDDLSDNIFDATFDVAVGGTGEALVSLTPLVADQFTNLVLAFVGGDGSVLAETPVGSGITTLTTIFGGMGGDDHDGDGDTLVQTLRITFDDAAMDASFDGQVTIAAIPLPAGGLLLLGALGAAGLVRRRRAA